MTLSTKLISTIFYVIALVLFILLAVAVGKEFPLLAIGLASVSAGLVFGSLPVA